MIQLPTKKKHRDLRREAAEEKGRVLALRSHEKRWEAGMFRKRDLSPLPEKRRLEQSSMCARDCFLVTSEHRSCSMKGALEEGRLVQGKTMRAVKEQSRLTIRWASLVLTCVQGETRNSVGMSYSLEEIVPCILPPLHSRHLTKTHLILL